MVRRSVAVIGILLVIVVGLVVHYVLPGSQGTDIAGDALYALVAYLGVVALAPRWHPVIVLAISAGWCIAVELFQLTGLPEAWGAQFSPIMLLLGTVFDPRDLLIYAVTAAVAAAIDLGVGALNRR